MTSSFYLSIPVAMKSLFYLLIAITFFGCSDQIKVGKDQYRISGLVKATNDGPYNDYIFFSYGGIKDSALVDEDGHFVFYGQLERPTRAYFHLRPPSANVSLYIENSDIYVSGQYFKSFQNETNYQLFYIDSVGGSPSNDMVAAYEKFTNDHQGQENFDSLHVVKLTQMATDNPRSSIVGTLIADQAAKSERIFNLEQLKNIYALLDTAYQQKAEMEVIKSGLAQLKNSVIGSRFMDFSITGYQSDSITFNDFLGKKTLVDFWASWCLPCVKKHPAMTSLYERSDKDRFQIISVSIDQDKASWSAMLEKEQLPWPNAFDGLDAVENQYGINAIPFNYLLNEQGEIMAVNQSLEEIESLITE